MKKWVVLVFALTLVFGMGLQAAGKTDDQVAKKAKKAYEKGLELFKQKQLDKAEEQFKLAIQLEPEWALGYAGLASMQKAENKIDDALPNYEKALALNPELKGIALEYADTLSKLGYKAINDGQLEKGNEYLLKTLAVPGLEGFNLKFCANLVYYVGNNFVQLNQQGKAIAYFLKAIQMTENQLPLADLKARAHYMAGLTYFNLKKFDDAKPHYAKYLELTKDNAAAVHFAGIAHYMLGVIAYDFLFETVQKVKAEPIGAERKAKIDQLNLQLEKLQKVRAGKSRIDKVAGDIVALQNEDKQEKKDKIAKMAQENVDIEPNLTSSQQGAPEVQEDAVMRLGNYYYLCENYEKAIAAYKQLIEKFPTSPDISSYKSFLQSLEKESKEVKK